MRFSVIETNRVFGVRFRMLLFLYGYMLTLLF